MAKKVVFYGAKTLAKIATEICHESNIDIVGYIDDFENEANIDLPNYLGTLKDNLALVKDFSFVVAVGNNQNRRILSEKIYQLGGEIVNLVHPRAYISKSSSMGHGNIFFPFVYVGANVKVGDGNVFFPSTVISHDIIIGNYCFFAPSVAVAGFTEIQDEVKIATSSSVSAESRIESRFEILNENNWKNKN